MSTSKQGQWGKLRKYTSLEEGVTKDAVQCPQCKVLAVSRRITDTRYKVGGEHHCPNCGHIHGRDSLIPPSKGIGLNANFVIEDSNGDPVEGATVIFGQTYAITDEEGKATIIAPEGEYTYSVYAEGYVLVEDTFELEEESEITATILENSILTFTITDEGSALVEGATVIVPGIGAMVTGDDGIADFSLPGGDYDWVVEKDGFASEYSPAPATVGDEAEADVAVTISVGSLVTFDVEDEGSASIEGATVELTGYPEAETDEHGIATIRVLNDDYTWTVTKEGFVTQTSGAPVTIDSDQTISVALVAE